MEHSFSPWIFVAFFVASVILVAAMSHLYAYIMDRLHPPDPYQVLHDIIGKRVWYQHPDVKVKHEGQIIGIHLAPGKAKGGKKRYHIIISTGHSEVKVDLLNKREWGFI
jgi:hypothetical protein